MRTGKAVWSMRVTNSGRHEATAVEIAVTASKDICLNSMSSTLMINHIAAGSSLDFRVTLFGSSDFADIDVSWNDGRKKRVTTCQTLFLSC